MVDAICICFADACLSAIYQIMCRCHKAELNPDFSIRFQFELGNTWPHTDYYFVTILLYYYITFPGFPFAGTLKAGGADERFRYPDTTVACLQDLSTTAIQSRPLLIRQFKFADVTHCPTDVSWILHDHCHHRLTPILAEIQRPGMIFRTVLLNERLPQIADVT